MRIRLDQVPLEAGVIADNGALPMYKSGEIFAGRFEIQRRVGAGPWGPVYRARDRVLDSSVALKVIRATPQDAEEEALFKQSLQQQQLLGRQVTHPNVIGIQDIGEWGDTTYVTMPFVEGEDLRTILKRERQVPLLRALAIGRQIASGLAAAHSAGVVHGNLKPANIMVTADDRALITDFRMGLSHAADTGALIVGNLEYISPEQAAGKPINERSDIYSFGVILYEMLAGRRPGDVSDLHDVLYRLQHAPAPLHTVDPGIPLGVSRSIAKCLEPDPSQRYGRMTELVRDLDDPRED